MLLIVCFNSSDSLKMFIFWDKWVILAKFTEIHSLRPYCKLAWKGLVRFFAKCGTLVTVLAKKECFRRSLYQAFKTKRKRGAADCTRNLCDLRIFHAVENLLLSTKSQCIGGSVINTSLNSTKNFISHLALN